MFELDVPPDSPPYVADIHAQPAALQAVLEAPFDRELRGVLRRLRGFERVVLTGMGASLFAQIPTLRRLRAAGVAAWNVETAELLGDQVASITPRTLLWITSQSGASAEVAALLELVAGSGATVLGTTNDVGGALARAADVVIPLHSGDERTVSTRSYVNTLAAHALATDLALGLEPARELSAAPTILAEWLGDWEAHVAELDGALPETTLFLLGRGASLAAAQTGALIIKEAAKTAVEGMSAPQFRHGPFELADGSVGCVVLAGGEHDVAANGRTVTDLRRLGANALLLGGPDAPVLPALREPRALPLAEILPLQALSVVLARRRGLEPGAFVNIEKVTRTL